MYRANMKTTNLSYRVPVERSLQLGKKFLALRKIRYLTTVLIESIPLLVRLYGGPNEYSSYLHSLFLRGLF